MVDAHAKPAERHPVIVIAPRAYDAIGDSLRRVYGQAPSLPDSLNRLLAKLS